MIKYPNSLKYFSNFSLAQISYSGLSFESQLEIFVDLWFMFLRVQQQQRSISWKIHPHIPLLLDWPLDNESKYDLAIRHHRSPVSLSLCSFNLAVFVELICPSVWKRFFDYWLLEEFDLKMSPCPVSLTVCSSQTRKKSVSLNMYQLQPLFCLFA